MRSGTWLPLVLLWGASAVWAQTKLVLQDGTELEVAEYEIRDATVVLTTLDGRVQSLPLALVDIDATEARAAGEVVPLRFAWKPGMSARVEAQGTRTRSRTDRAGPRTFENNMRYRLTVREHEEGILVEHDDFELPELELPESAEALGIDNDWIQRVQSLVPSYVVRDGEFVRIVGVEALEAELEAAMRPMREHLGSNEAQRLLDAVTSEERLTARMAEEWNALAGFWVDSDAELGAFYQLQTDAPFPLLPGLSLPVVLEFGAVRRTACTPDHPELDCVELEVRSFPDPERMRVLMDTLVEKLGGGTLAARPKFEELHVETLLTLVSRPGDLLPYSLETVKDVRLLGSTENGEPIDVSQQDRRRLRFHWEP